MHIFTIRLAACLLAVIIWQCSIPAFAQKPVTNPVRAISDTVNKPLNLLEEGTGTFPDLFQGLAFIPPSPTSSALAKFIDIPVTHYTGAANVSIPLLGVNEKDIKLNVELNYHTSGIKVDEAPGWVGQNWSLSTSGGVITRTVSGLADESPNGFLGRFAEVQTIADLSSPNLNTYYETLKDYSYNEFDSQPDIFFLSIPGYAVKFYLKPDGIVTIPFTKLVITPTIVSNMITAFTVKTTSGLTYNFNQPETSQIGMSPGDYVPMSFNSSWYPGTITSPNGYSASFEYFPNQNVSFLANYSRSKRDKYNEFGSASSSSGTPLSCPFPVVSGGGFGIFITNAKKIKKIITSNGYIEFFLSNNRQDTGNIYGVTSYDFQDSKLDKIELHDAAGTLVRGFNLAYGYMGPSVGKRMKLASVTEFGGDLAVLPPTAFTYEESNVPAIFSNAQDHWGFQNSSFGDLYRIPELNWGGTLYTGANRETDQINMAYLVGGSLSKITYPTGGTTSFGYESHKQLVSGSQVSIGGLRIKEIINTDPVTGNVNKKTYSYDSGYLLDIPKYDHTQSLRIGDQFTPNAGLYKTCEYLVRTSKSNNVVGAGAHIVYLHVTEFNGSQAENGKTDYYYTYPQIPVVHDFPFPPQDVQSIVGGVLSEKKVSNASGQSLWREQSSFNNASINADNAYEMKGFVIGRNYEWTAPYLDYADLNMTYAGLFTIRKYNIWQRWLYMNKREVTTYDQADTTKSVKTTANYFYENPTNAQLTKETSTDSKGNAVEKTYKYPQDFSTTLPYSEMIASNVFMISPVIESQEKVGGSNTVLKKTDYEKIGGKYLPKRVKSKLGSGAEYQDLVFDSYDARANPTQYTGRDGLITSLEYFGPTDTGKTDLLKKKTVAAGTGSEQAITYSYKPLAGVSNITDPAGKSTFYDYDQHARLKTVKNPDGKARVSYCYNYAGQVVDCDALSPTGKVTTVPLTLLTEVTAPDLIPQLLITPASFTNGTVVEFRVNVIEIGGLLPTNGSEITVRVAKNPLFTNFTWNSALTSSSSGISVHNSIWTASENANFYIFKTSAIIPKASQRRLLFQLTSAIPTGSASAQFAIPVSITPNSGGELNVVNNASSTVVQIF